MKPPKLSHPLAGKFFHSIKDGVVSWQGMVIDVDPDGIAVCQLFSYLDGSANVIRIIRVAEMMEWLFYNDADEMTFSYDKGVAREGGLYRKRIPQ